MMENVLCKMLREHFSYEVESLLEAIKANHDIISIHYCLWVVFVCAIAVAHHFDRMKLCKNVCLIL
jgi:hypothetical protein